jgi:hypothetical protein
MTTLTLLMVVAAVELVVVRQVQRSVEQAQQDKASMVVMLQLAM